MYCDDDDLAYAKVRYRFVPGDGLPLGADYRLAHLPLVAPAHPDCIASVPGRDYANGRYATRRAALVLKIDADALQAEPAFCALEAAMRAAPFGAKIAWDMGVRRRDVLHATLAATPDDAALLRLAQAGEKFLATHGELRVALGGPFVGNRNHGRMYLPVYPPKIGGADALATLLAAADFRSSGFSSGFYGVGFWHFADALDAAEAAALSDLLDAHWGRRLVANMPVRLGILTVDNDLALPPVAWRWIEAASG